MIDPALGLLTERLLWPVPRIRLEAARGLATLIRAGSKDARLALLDWMSRQSMESEAVLGLGVIDGFDLATHFAFAEVTRAIRAPSHLSDYLLKKNFPDASGLFPFRYEIAPSDPAPLPAHQTEWFERYKHAAVPPVFDSTLSDLERRTGWPFLARWKHDWNWLQTRDPRPMPDRPWFFFGSDRENVGQIDQGLRETYVSAYLRTLAHAAVHGPMPHDAAENHSLLALTVNRGLADLQPVPRPVWASGLTNLAGGVEGLARGVWEAATAHAGPEDALLHVRVAEGEENAFTTIELCLAIGEPGFEIEGAAPMVLREILVGHDTGEFHELFRGYTDPTDIPLSEPLVLTQEIYPAWPGRFHTDLMGQMALASPYLFGPAVIQGDGDGIALRRGAKSLSRWQHWYLDWAPTLSRELRSSVGWLTTISADVLVRTVDGARAKTGVWVRAKIGKRERSYSDFEVEAREFWLTV